MLKCSFNIVWKFLFPLCHMLDLVIACICLHNTFALSILMALLLTMKVASSNKNSSKRKYIMCDNMKEWIFLRWLKKQIK
jgi:hypothetical protein